MASLHIAVFILKLQVVAFAGWRFLSLSLLRYLVFDLFFVERCDRALSQVDNKVGAVGTV